MTLIRPPPRPRKTNRCPHIGSRFSVSCTISDRPGKPLRMSVWPVASQTFTPAGTGIIAAPVRNRGCGQARPCRCRYARGPTAATQLNRDIAALSAKLGCSRGRRLNERLSKWPRTRSPAPTRFQSRSADPRSGTAPWPTEQLADMDTGRAGNLGDHRVWLKAGSDESLFIFA